MATFRVDGRPKLTILIDGTDITIVTKNACVLCLVSSLDHCIFFRNVTYDANNNVSSLVYQVSIAIVQGQEWVVSSKRYMVVGANVFTHS